MKYHISAHTDLGFGREVNEDFFAYCPDVEKGQWVTSREDGSDAKSCKRSTEGFQHLSSLGALLVVADGMGGRQSGDVASAMVADTIQRLCSPEQMKTLEESCDSDTVHQFLKDVVLQADKEIRAHTLEHFETIGMGTTLVLLWVHGGKADVAWCGDSRAYLYTPKSGLRRLSTDHSYVQELCTRGEITEDEMLTHPDSNLLTRCVGDTDFEANAETLTVDVQSNSMFMLCTDGLSGYSYERDVQHTIYQHYTTADIPLVELALELEAQDNITTLTMSIIDDEAKQPTIPVITQLKKFFT